MTRAQAAAREIWSLDNGARQHQHAHCAQQARPPLLSRTASRACTLTAPGLSVRTVLRVVAVDLLRPRRLAADRAADGLHERCDIRATVDLQHDEQCVTASLPDAPGTAPQPSARRPRQHGDLVASLNRHVPGLVRLCSYRPDPTESHGIVPSRAETKRNRNRNRKTQSQPQLPPANARLLASTKHCRHPYPCPPEQSSDTRHLRLTGSYRTRTHPALTPAATSRERTDQLPCNARSSAFHATAVRNHQSLQRKLDPQHA
jgi:hypothetical protein